MFCAKPNSKISLKLSQIEFKGNKYLRKIWIFKNLELEDLIKNLMRFLEEHSIQEDIHSNWFKNME